MTLKIPNLPAARKTTKNVLNIIKPPPILTVSEWSDNHRRLSAEASSEAGVWSTSRAEYQRGIMDAISDDAIEAVTIMSCAQVGKTEMLLNLIGYHIEQDPSPILVVQPTLDMAQTFSKDRLAPMLRDTPVLKGKVKDPTEGATHYHATYVRPAWAKTKTKTTRIDRHIFYRWER